MGLGRLNFFRANSVDLRLALRQSLDSALVDIETGDGRFLFGKQQGQGQSHIAQPNDPDARLALLDPVFRGIDSAICDRVFGHCYGGNLRFFRMVFVSMLASSFHPFCLQWQTQLEPGSLERWCAMWCKSHDERKGRDLYPL